MTEEELKRTNRTYSCLYSDLEESQAQRSSSDFELACPNPREYSELFESRWVDRPNQDLVTTSVTKTRTWFRAVFDRWGVVIKERPAVLNGVSIDNGQIVLFPPGVEVEGDYEAGVEFGLATDEEKVAGFFRGALPRQVVGVRVDPAMVTGLASAIRGQLDGDPAEGGILSRCLAPFDVSSERLLTPARERLASGIREVIDARLSTQICLSEISRELGVSMRTAERAFAVRFQETMVGYIKRARLDRARELLMTGKTVTRAASDAGWAHLGRFSVEFRKRFGESPSALRKRHAPAPG